LSNISDVPRSRTYDILESLEKKGFIVMKLGKPIKFVALKPEEVVERVKKNLMKNAKERTQRLETLKGDEVLDELTGLFTKGVKFVEPSDLSGSLKGRQNLYNHLDMLIRDAEKSVTIVTTAEGLSRKLEFLMPSLEKCKKRGIKIRIAAPIDSNNSKVAKEFLSISMLRLDLLLLDNKVIAFSYSFEKDGRFFYYTPAFNNAYAKYSPGTVLLMHILQNAFKRGVKEFDLVERFLTADPLRQFL